MDSRSEVLKIRIKHLLLIFTVLFFARHSLAQDSDKKNEQPPTAAQTPVIKGKTPIIVIPGLIGSELVNKNTGDTVWFNLSRAKDDDLRLPISRNLNANRDNLVAGDIIRNVKYLKFLPETEIYQGLTTSLVIPGGYKEGKLDAPEADGFQDTYYIYPYDWRLDNVTNARLLIRKIQALKLKFKRPNLKFNIVGHSMGGLIARYAARYGDADLPAGTRPIRPTWAGARHIDKIFLVGTPNEGSFSSLDALLNGVAPFDTKGINLPFIQSISKFDAFTIPSMYQLLPHGETGRSFGEDLKPLKLDLYNPATWEKYGWAIYQDSKFAKEFSAAEQKQAREYFRQVLYRAKRFHQSLDTRFVTKTPVEFYLIGADCKPTLDGMIVYRNAKKDRYETIFNPESFKQSDGTKITSNEVKALLYREGDGVVTRDSLLGSSLPNATMQSGYKVGIYAQDILFTCEAHNKLTGNPEAQKKMFAVLNGSAKPIAVNK